LAAHGPNAQAPSLYARRVALRRGLLVLVGLAACGRFGFDGLVASGDAGDGGVGGDGDGGSVDGPPGGPGGDPDMDGVLNAIDNCPVVANPQQENEDGDRFGDACDPCPPFADGDPIDDTDGDNVSALCDPFPNTPGDAIVVFAGFSSGAPPGVTQLGPWTYTAGRAEIAGSLTSVRALLWPSQATGTETVYGRGTIDAILGSGIVRGMGGTIRGDSIGTMGIFCGLALSNIDQQVAALWNVGTQSVLDVMLTTVAVGTNFTFKHRRTGNAFTCYPQTTGNALTATDGLSPISPLVGAGTFAMSGRFDWILIVSSP
jgi:hypothetical protein